MQNLVGRSFFLLAVLLITMNAWPGPAVAQWSDRAPSRESGDHLQKARERFLENDMKAAAGKIREAADVLAREIESAEGGAKEILSGTEKRLRTVADNVEQGGVKSVQQLDRLFDQAFTPGRARRGWIGARVENVEEWRRNAGLQGVYVSTVVKGGPADRAGLQKNDLVLDYRGRRAGSAGELRNDIAGTPAREKAALTLMRNGKRIRISVTVENLEQASPFLLKEAESRLGARIWSITWDKAAQKRIGQGYGVVVGAVNPKGPLGQAGLQAGDAIIETDGHKVEDFDDFLEFVDSLDAHQTAALLIRNRAGMEIGPVLLKIE